MGHHHMHAAEEQTPKPFALYSVDPASVLSWDGEQKLEGSEPYLLE